MKINDQCTDAGYCDQEEGSNTAHVNTLYKKDVHFDLCNATGVTNQFFGQIGAGVAIGYAQQLPDCSALDDGPFGSQLGTLDGGAANAGGVPASGALPGIALGALPISASGPEPSLGLGALRQFESQVNGADKAPTPAAGEKQAAHVVVAGAQSTTMGTVVISSTAAASSSSTGSVAVGGAVAASSSSIGIQTSSAPVGAPAQSSTLVAVVSSSGMLSSSSVSPIPSSSGVASGGPTGQEDNDEDEQDDCDEL